MSSISISGESVTLFIFDSLLKNLTTCVKHFIGYPCSETDEIANMMGENIQEIARSFIFNETGTSGVDITKWLAPFRCDGKLVIH